MRRLKAVSASSPTYPPINYTERYMWIAVEPKVRIVIQSAYGTIQSTTLLLSDAFECEIDDPALEKELLPWLRAYARKASCPIPQQLSIETLGPFHQRALRTMSEVPIGETISYMELAARSGSPRGARAAGNACHRNPFPLFYPCHRIIGSDGNLTGFALDIEIKRRLLQFEGKMRSRPHIKID